MNTLKEYNLTESTLIQKESLQQFFNILIANIERSRTALTTIFLTINSRDIFWDKDRDIIEEGITSYLQRKIRQTDLLFKLPQPNQWCIILSQSKEEEAKAFLERLFTDVKNSQEPLFSASPFSFCSSIAEIGNSNVLFEELLITGERALEKALKKGDWHVEFVADYKERNIEQVKVSIIEHDAIFQNILSTTLHNITVDHFQLNIKTFLEGNEFLQSDWSGSSHTHLVILNDILPKKNGLEILHLIRKLPNNKRFIIFMMTKRNSEEDIIYAYESGVDYYIIKPLNIRLLEAQIRRTLERLWA